MFGRATIRLGIGPHSSYHYGSFSFEFWLECIMPFISTLMLIFF